MMHKTKKILENECATTLAQASRHLKGKTSNILEQTLEKEYAIKNDLLEKERIKLQEKENESLFV